MTPTRRDVLIAAGAVAVIGAGAAVEAGTTRRDRLLHRFGLADSPDHTAPPSGTRLVSGALTDGA